MQLRPILLTLGLGLGILALVWRFWPAAITPPPTMVAVPPPAANPMPTAAVHLAPAPVTAHSKLAASKDVSMELLMQPDPNPDYVTFGDRLQEVMSRRNGQTLDAQRLWQASQQSAAWSPSDIPGDQLPLSDADRSDGREFIRMDPLKVESLVPGDHLEIPITQTNQTYTAKIDQVRVDDQGSNITWSGHLEGLENDNQFYITRGDSLIVAGITTPDGLLNLEARGDQGWIANSATLFKRGEKLVDIPASAPDGSTGGPHTQN